MQGILARGHFGSCMPSPDGPIGDVRIHSLQPSRSTASMARSAVPGLSMIIMPHYKVLGASAARLRTASAGAEH